MKYKPCTNCKGELIVPGKIKVLNLFSIPNPLKSYFCPSCMGTGREPVVRGSCSDCNGVGRQTLEIAGEFRSGVCPTCLGSGSEGKALIENGGVTWYEIERYLTENTSKIISIRGCGSVNGMSVSDATRITYGEMAPRIRRALEDFSRVFVLYDGDPENHDWPDVGYVTGSLLRLFDDDSRVVFIAAQKTSWYYPPSEEGNLENSSGGQYLTYVFPDGKYPGDHNTFTQSLFLVRESKHMEMWIVGAAGKITTEQLIDFQSKVPSGERRKVVLFKAHVNPQKEGDLRQKLLEAENSQDWDKVVKIREQIYQRNSYPYGYLWNPSGSKLSFDPALSFPYLDFELP